MGRMLWGALQSLGSLFILLRPTELGIGWGKGLMRRNWGRHFLFLGHNLILASKTGREIPSIISSDRRGNYYTLDVSAPYLDEVGYIGYTKIRSGAGTNQEGNIEYRGT